MSGHAQHSFTVGCDGFHEPGQCKDRGAAAVVEQLALDDPTAEQLAAVEICNRCLIVPDDRVGITARIPRGDGLLDMPFAQFPTDVRWLKDWAADVLARGGVIVVNNWSNMFRAISTFYGDPVCAAHLLQLVSDERARPGMRHR